MEDDYQGVFFFFDNQSGASVAPCDTPHLIGHVIRRAQDTTQFTALLFEREIARAERNRTCDSVFIGGACLPEYNVIAFTECIVKEDSIKTDINATF